MRTELIREYLDFLNILNIVLDNDNIAFVIKRKNYIFPPEQMGAIVEKCQINIVIDGRDYFFSVAYANPSADNMKIKYNDLYLDDILMCLGGEFTEFHELNVDDIHRHVKKFDKRYFTEMIQRIIIDQKRLKVVKALLGLTAKEVRREVLYYKPKWVEDSGKDDSRKKATDTLKAIRVVVSELYDDNLGEKIEIKIASNGKYGYEHPYEIFTFTHRIY